MPIVMLFIGSVLAEPDVTDSQVNRANGRWHTASKFQLELERSIHGAWRGANVRSIVHHISVQTRIAILLDRRIDPTQEITLDVQGVSLRNALNQIATQVECDLSIVGNTVYIGPANTARKLRTLVEIRSAELSTGIPLEQQRSIKRRTTITWNDLESPEEILSQIEDTFDIEMTAALDVPHDLWAGAVLPEATAIEALTFILGQFDWTFEWLNGGRNVRVMPIPKSVAVTKSYRIRARDANRVEGWKAKIPGLEIQVEPGRIVVTGTVEQHDAVHALRNPTRNFHAPRSRDEQATEGSLNRRQFTLQIERIPASEVLKKLEQSGITVIYDSAALSAANVDLNQPISIDVKQASADEFFATICRPLGLVYELDGLTVRLKPKRSR